MTALLEAYKDKTEAQLLCAHWENPQDMDTLNELVYFYSTLKIDKAKGDYFETLLQQMIARHLLG